METPTLMSADELSLRTVDNKELPELRFFICDTKLIVCRVIAKEHTC